MFFIPGIIVNIKSLCAEAHIIKYQSKKYEGYNREALINHRRNVVRPEARLANLAYGFMKGRKRSEVEKSFKKDVDPNRLLNKVKKFSMSLKPIEISQIVEWLKT